MKLIIKIDWWIMLNLPCESLKEVIYFFSPADYIQDKPSVAL